MRSIFYDASYGTAMELQDWLGPLLGGAIGAALINVVFGFWKHQADRKNQHRRWLRDKKLEAYVDFFESSKRVHNFALQAPSVEWMERVSGALREVEASSIHLLASKDIAKACDEAYDQMIQYVEVCQKHTLSLRNRNTKLDVLSPKVAETRQRLEALCRSDLMK